MGRWITLIFLNKYIIIDFRVKFVFLVSIEMLKNHWNGETRCLERKYGKRKWLERVGKSNESSKNEQLLRDCIKSNPCKRWCKRRSYVAAFLIRWEEETFLFYIEILPFLYLNFVRDSKNFHSKIVVSTLKLLYRIKLCKDSYFEYLCVNYWTLFLFLCDEKRRLRKEGQIFPNVSFLYRNSSILEFRTRFKKIVSTKGNELLKTFSFSFSLIIRNIRNPFVQSANSQIIRKISR